MSLLREVSVKTLYNTNVKLLLSIFHHPPQMVDKQSSYFNRILQIHQIIRNDLIGTCTTDTPSLEQPDIASIETVSKSLKKLEQTIFGKIKKEYPATVLGCISHTESILSTLESNNSNCTIL